jgi:hypothetical protein
MKDMPPLPQQNINSEPYCVTSWIIVARLLFCVSPAKYHASRMLKTGLKQREVTAGDDRPRIAWLRPSSLWQWLMWQTWNY